MEFVGNYEDGSLYLLSSCWQVEAELRRVLGGKCTGSHIGEHWLWVFAVSILIVGVVVGNWAIMPGR